MQMRAGRKAGRADIADDVAGLHREADLYADGEAAHMGVGRRLAAAMVDLDDIAVALAVAGEGYRAIEGRLDRRADRRTPVDALVNAHLMKNGMHPRAEGRGQHALDGRHHAVGDG